MGLVVHSRPRACLMCHQCNAIHDMPTECPRCHGSRLLALGIGLQRVETSLKKLFPEVGLCRVDSDARRTEKLTLSHIRDASIILGTELVNTMTIEGLGLVGFVLVESEMVVPEYDIEERIYANVLHNLKRGCDTYIQTHIPEHPLITAIAEGNFRDFFRTTLGERRTFGYPPFGEVAVVRVRDRSLAKVDDSIAKLVNKLQGAELSDISIVFDRQIHERHAGHYVKKILLR